MTGKIVAVHSLVTLKPSPLGPEVLRFEAVQLCMIRQRRCNSNGTLTFNALRRAGCNAKFQRHGMLRSTCEYRSVIGKKQAKLNAAE